MKLNYFQALHLVRIEHTKGDQLEMVAQLVERGDITTSTEIQLQDWIDFNWSKATPQALSGSVSERLAKAPTEHFDGEPSCNCDSCHEARLVGLAGALPALTVANVGRINFNYQQWLEDTQGHK